MRQTYVCEYLGITCKHLDTFPFLHLPASIRQKVYIYAGLIFETHTPWPIPNRRRSGFYVTTPEQDYIVTQNLAQVCRQVREEVELLVLSENTIVYSAHNVDYGLNYLAGLGPFACSVLKSVHVQLHCGRDEYVYGRDPPPLSEKRIGIWVKACHNILAHATYQQLRLHLLCDTGLSSKTESVLAPLRMYPGVLLELELRLHHRDAKFRQGPEHRQLLDLAREVGLQAQGRDPNACPKKPFRFFNLPVEVRLSVYQYTNLVTPHRKVHWTPEKGFHVRIIFCECDGSVCQEEDLHANLNLTECGANSPNTAGYCMRTYSSYSPRCKHGNSPLSLFLVSRQMYEEAIDFFYANNRVVVQPHFHVDSVIFAGEEAKSPHIRRSVIELPEPTALLDMEGLPDADGQPVPEQQPDEDEQYDPEQPEHSGTRYMNYDTTKLFISRVGHRGVKLMREVEIIFPRIGLNSSLSDTDSAYKEWCMAVEYLASCLGGSKLTLFVHIWTTPAGQYTTWPLARTARLVEEYAPRLLEPLRGVTRLKRLFVYLEWPEHWAPPRLHHDVKTCKIPKTDSPGCGIGYHYIPTSKGEIVAKEVCLEKMIMGKQYDSYSVGKGNELPSQWLRSEWDSIGY